MQRLIKGIWKYLYCCSDDLQIPDISRGGYILGLANSSRRDVILARKARPGTRNGVFRVHVSSRSLGLASFLRRLVLILRDDFFLGTLGNSTRSCVFFGFAR